MQQALNSNIIIENEKFEILQYFTYLGNKKAYDRKCEKDIKSSIAQAKQAFCKNKNLLLTNNVSLKSRKTLMKSFSWSIRLFGVETWKIFKAERKRNEAF